MYIKPIIKQGNPLKKLILIALFSTFVTSAFAANAKLIKHCVNSGGWYAARLYTSTGLSDFINLGNQHCSFTMVAPGEDYTVDVFGDGFNFHTRISIPASELQDYSYILTELWGSIFGAGTNTTKNDGRDLNLTNSSGSTIVCLGGNGMFNTNLNPQPSYNGCNIVTDGSYDAKVVNTGRSNLVNINRGLMTQFPANELRFYYSGTVENFNVEVEIK